MFTTARLLAPFLTGAIAERPSAPAAFGALDVALAIGTSGMALAAQGGAQAAKPRRIRVAEDGGLR